MIKLAKRALMGTAIAAVMTVSASAADLFSYEPPVYDYDPPKEVSYKKHKGDFGGWYIRGDVGHRWSRLRGTEYILQGTPEIGSFDTTSLSNGFTIGGGVGYQVNRYFRTDLTVDHWLKSDFRGSTSGFDTFGEPVVSTDTSSYSATLFLANAYAEFGKFKRITPYVGAGIGGAHVRWDDLRNRYTESDGTEVDDLHAGAKGWRFAWALMAGASYCINSNLKADVGYRFSRIEGGRMFEATSPDGEFLWVGPGFDRGLTSHEVRAGLRYQFGDGNKCGKKDYIAYEPPAKVPDFQPIFK